MSNYKLVYVVTCPENGWDCVCGVFLDEEKAREEYPNEDTYVIHQRRLIE